MASIPFIFFFIRWVGKAFTGLVCLLYLVSIYLPKVSPEYIWWSGPASLVSPYLMFFLVLMSIAWLLTKPFWAIMPIIVLCFGFERSKAIFGTHADKGFLEQKKKEDLRLVDWNVRAFNGADGEKKSSILPSSILVSILDQRPDIVCLQEFNQNTSKNNPNDPDNHLRMFKANFKYCYFSKDFKKKNGYQSGVVIFSKYPMMDSGRLKFPNGESMIYADIKKGHDTFRIYTAHLQSFHLEESDYTEIGNLIEKEDAIDIHDVSLLKKMKLAYRKRAKQSNLVRSWLEQCTYPNIVTGDFNDVPNSYTYNSIKGNRKDAFLEKSFGFGKTYNGLAPTLRIDYILPDNNFNITQFQIVDNALSDHCMLVTDLHKKTIAE